jgi:hypothetical protein
LIPKGIIVNKFAQARDKDSNSKWTKQTEKSNFCSIERIGR